MWLQGPGLGPLTREQDPRSEGPGAQVFLQGAGAIPSYVGDLPAPLRLMWYVPENASELFTVHYPAAEIRGWLRDAAAYHGVPLELAAVILQIENPREHSFPRKVLQFGERSATTFLAIVDEVAFDLVPDKIGGLHIAEGSTGIANMRRHVVREAADYIERTLGRRVMPDEARRRVFGWDQDSRIPGDDLKADFYYFTARLRQLIDTEMGAANYSGPLGLPRMQNIVDRYVGYEPGNGAWSGNKALSLLHDAANCRGPLYFYEK